LWYSAVGGSTDGEAANDDDDIEGNSLLESADADLDADVARLNLNSDLLADFNASFDAVPDAVLDADLDPDHRADLILAYANRSYHAVTPSRCARRRARRHVHLLANRAANKNADFFNALDAKNQQTKDLEVNSTIRQTILKIKITNQEELNIENCQEPIC
jgi:hypothetical protein